jgi:DNA-directed RNA polymerase specialized sigma24 family protein
MKRFKPTQARPSIAPPLLDRLKNSPPGGEHGIAKGLGTIAPSFVSFMIRAANFHAISLVRCGVFRWDELEDISQDLLLDLHQRLSRYRPSRGGLYSFARLVMQNQAKVLFQRKSRYNRRIVQVDMTYWEQQPTPLSPFEDLSFTCNLRVDVRDAVCRLPAPLRDLAENLQKQAIPEVCARTGRSRSRIYQMIGQIRRSFAESGLVSYRARGVRRNAGRKKTDSPARQF